MRVSAIISAVLLMSGLAAAQATIVGGEASNWGPAYGWYLAGPFVPLVTTPSISLSAGPHARAGASNATWGNVAGARNSTLETLPEDGYEHAAHERPRWNGGPPEMHAEPSREMRHEGRDEKETRFNGGVAAWEFSRSVIELKAEAGGKKAARTYTNDDVQRMNDSNGTVKWDGKTEKI